MLQVVRVLIVYTLIHCTNRSSAPPGLRSTRDQRLLDQIRVRVKEVMTVKRAPAHPSEAAGEMALRVRKVVRRKHGYADAHANIPTIPRRRAGVKTDQVPALRAFRASTCGLIRQFKLSRPRRLNNWGNAAHQGLLHVGISFTQARLFPGGTF